MSVSRIGRAPLGELAARQLRQRLADGAWEVGQRLPSEVELAEQLGVGRSTVREAVRVLAHEGLLETRQGAGTFVLSREPMGEWEPRLRRAAVLEVYELREALELQAARLASVRRDAASLARIEQAFGLREERRAQARDAAFVDADIAFHRAVVAAAGNPLLEEMYDAFTAVLREALIEVVSDAALDPDDASIAHADLVAAIRQQDVARAESATRDNVSRTAAELRLLLG
jgi:GntR family transcriptional regulator, transcriptional repressor for pyruvate dehydrogenase complex